MNISIGESVERLARFLVAAWLTTHGYGTKAAPHANQLWNDIVMNHPDDIERTA